ncbi:MAG: IS30 family transposase [Nitrospirota bacterium]
MPKPYKQLSQSEREHIASLLAEGYSLGDIAKVIGRNKSTISRELARNRSPEYQRYTPCRAHARACERKTTANTHDRLKNDFIRQYVKDSLKKGWSPEQISGRIRIDHPGYSINHEAIYQYIYHPRNPHRLEMINLLRRAQKKRRTKGIGRKERKTKIPNRIPIDARPKSVENRHRCGHWESDSLISRKSKAALNTLAERKSRLVLITKLCRKGATETNRAIINRLKKFPANGRQTLTLDNGTENAKHERLSAKIGIKCYFAHPYSSWERGTNENLNGLIRWYLPKGTDFSKITPEQIARIEYLLNSRPRKCLGYKTPLEVAASSVALRH